MTRTTAKRITAVLVGLLLALAVLSGLSRAGELWRASLQGARPADAFTPADILPVGGAADVTFRTDGILGRPLDPGTREAIGRAWSEAWIRADVAATSGDGSDLRTSFSGSALTQTTAALHPDGTGVPTQARGHDLEVRFFSADGAIAEVRAHDLTLLRTAVTGDGPRVQRWTETWDAVMRLRDGRWRIDVITRSEARLR